MPQAAHLEAAQQLVDTYLEAGGQKLLQLLEQGPGGAGSGSGASGAAATAAGAVAGAAGGAAGEEYVRWKSAVQARLACMSAVALGAMSSLRDFSGLDGEPAGASGASAGNGCEAGGLGMRLSAVGRLGVPVRVGKQGARERAAAVLAAAVARLRGGDRELCEVALAAGMVLLGNGVMESLALGQQVGGGVAGECFFCEPGLCAYAFCLQSAGYPPPIPHG